MFKKITHFLFFMTAFYGVLHQVHAMNGKALTLKTGEEIMCNEIPHEELNQHDLQILKDNFGQNIYLDVDGFKDNLLVNNKKCMRAQVVTKEALLTIGIAIYRDTDVKMDL